MDKVLLEAQERKEFSKANRSQLRQQKRVPGVLYSKHIEPIHFDVAENAINPLVFTSQTHIVALKVGDTPEVECVIKDIQFNPITDKVIHIDLLGITKGEKVQIEVPVQLVGQAVGVKDGGLLQQLLHKVEIECIPTDIPQHIELDITNLKLGEAIHASALNTDKYTVMNAEDSVVVAITTPRAEKEAVEGEASAEPEVIAKGKVDKE